jgi:PKD repeat protein
LLTNAAGCDSLVTLNLTINNSTNGTDVQTACDTYTWIDGLTYNASTNTPTFLLTNAAGCDSLVTLNLTINNSTNGTDIQTACDTYTWIDGLTYNASTNTPTFLLTNAAGCDSLVTLNLTINNSTNGTDIQTACDTYTWIDGLTYNASTNTPTFLLTNAAGCDSLVTLNLTINNSTNGTDVQTACDTYTWIDGLTYNASTNAPTFLLTNAAGCDSLVTLNLTINNSTNGTDVQTACDTYTWIDGLTYNASTNTPTFLLTNAAGCDSLVTLNLTINNSTNGTDVQTACDTYTWIDGLTYNASTNTPTFLLTNAVGCDSLVTLNLTINNSTNGTDVQTACDTYTWIDGLTYNASTNTPTFLLTNAAGCDSLVTLNLTINNSTNGTDIQTACDTYTWIDGLTYNASTNTPTFTYVGGSVNGCDSIVTLNLTINNGATGIDVQTACDTYTWIDGLTYNASTNTPTFTYVGGSVNGCDSIVTLNLTINNGATGIDIQTACDTYTWIDGLTYNASTNTPTFTYVGGSVNGCDSIVTLNLTINITPAAPTLVVVDNCGSSDVTASGITGTLIWSDLGTGNPRNFLTPTTLTVTQDLGGCISVASNSVTTNPLGITSITNTTINETCGLANGSYEVTSATGGTTPYSYSTDGITYVSTALFTSLSAGSYTIYVQDNNSCIYSEPFSISNTGGVASITNTTVDATCGLANGSYDITGITAGVAPYTYSIDGITYGGNTLFTGLAAGAYTIYVQDNNNCVYSEPFSISTSVAPITSAITGNTNPICTETGVTYSVVLTAGSSYAWTVPTGSIITNGATGPDNNVITVDLGSTNGNIAVTETNTAGCVGVAQSLVIGLQGCGLVANFSADTDTICEGASVTFTDLSTGTTGATTYFWDFGPSAVPSTVTGQGPHVITYIAPGPASVSLTVTDGIVSTLNNPNFITVNPILTPAVSITVSNSTICGPTVVDFNSNVINGGTNPSYQWQLNGFDIIGANADSLNINTLVETDVISLNVISNETCLSVSNASSNQIAIIDSCDAIITTLPLALNSYCAGSSLTVNYTVAGTVNSNNIFIAQLSNATGSFATPTNIGQLTSTTSGAITATIPDNTNAGLQYRIRVVSNSPSITGTDNGSDINVNTVNFGVDFSIANVNLNTIPMDALFTNNTPNLNQYNFTWFFGDGSQAVINTANLNYVYNYNGSYDVSLVATDITTGCSQTFYDTLNTILCSGFSTNACNHSASINAPNVINGCAGSQLNLNVNNYNPAFSYQWHRNGAAINGGNYESITINTSGFYSVTVFDTAGCPKTSNPIQVSFNLPSVTAPVVSISGLVGNCGQVIATLTAIGNFASYLWNTGVNADSINISQAGTYSVIGQGSLGCDAVSAPFPVSSSFLPTPTICMVTVDTLTNHHLLMWEKPVSSQIQAFAIYKEIPFNSNNYQQIVVLPYDSLSEYLDLNSDAEIVTDRYRLSFIDTCNGETAQSDFVRAIGLRVFPGVGVQRVLSWNSYTGAAQNITSYLVYSGPDFSSLSLLTTLLPGVPPYIDSNPIAGTNTVYRVETELSQSCESTRAVRNRSVSNSSGNTAFTYPSDVSIVEVTPSKYKFNILPNPNNGNFIINWENAEIAPDAKVWIESVYGEKVTNPVMMRENNTSISINVQSGVYFVRVNSSAGEWVTRLVIVN